MPGPFRRRRRLPIPSPEPDGARQLPGQRFDLFFGPLSARYICLRFRLVQFFAQFGQPPPILDLGLIVEHLARVAQSGDMDSCLLERFISPLQAAVGRTRVVVLASARNPTKEIEHMKFNPRMPQQMRQVSEAFGIPQTKCFSAVTNSPVLALFAKNSRARIPPACRRVAAASQLSSTAPHLGCHWNFPGEELSLHDCSFPCGKGFLSY